LVTLQIAAAKRFANPSIRFATELFGLDKLFAICSQLW
jgi:hypothetical protein